MGARRELTCSAHSARHRRFVSGGDQHVNTLQL
jgi:hypothetical protein